MARLGRLVVACQRQRCAMNRRVKVMLCPSCADALRRIRDDKGPEAMAEALSRVLCNGCRDRSGVPRGDFTTVLKRVN